MPPPAADAVPGGALAGAAPEGGPTAADLEAQALVDTAASKEQTLGYQKQVVTDPLVLEVANVVAILRKTLKTFSLYGTESKASTDFLARACETFHAHLEEFGALTVRVDAHTMLCGDDVVFEEESGGETFFYRLYQAGIRQLTFRPGLTDDELADFLEILSLDPESRTFHDDDVVTLFWKKEFVNLHYVVVDSFLDQADDIVRKGEVDYDTALEQIMSLVDKDLDPERAVKVFRIAEEDLTADHSLEQYADQLDDGASQNVYGLNLGELKELRAAILLQEERGYLTKVVDILVELLAWESDRADAQNLKETLSLIMDSAIAQGKLAVVARIVGGLRWLVVPRLDGHAYPEAALEAALEGLEEATIKDRIRPFLVQLGEETADRRMILDYLSSLPSEVAVTLTDLLEDVPRPEDRKDICDALAVLGRDDPRIFIDKLEHEKWFVVRDMIWLLGRLRYEPALQPVMNCFNHTSPPVRSEVVKTVTAFSDPDVKYFLFDALQDEEPDIQMLALSRLNRFPGEDTTARLLEMIKEPVFLERPALERREWFRALGEVAGAEDIPLLEQMVRSKRKLLDRPEKEQIKAGALYAISVIGGPEAAEALQRLEKVRMSGPVKMAYRRAMKVIESRGDDLDAPDLAPQE